LKVGGGLHQHRLGLHGSVLKVNQSREPLQDAPTNFTRLEISSPESRHLRDPDGNEVTMSPDIERIAVHWASSNPGRLAAMLRDGFDAVDVGDRELRVATTRVVLQPGGEPVGPIRSRGFRYLTAQVRDVRA